MRRLRSARSGGPTDRTGVAAGLRTRRPQFSVTLQTPGRSVSGPSHGPARGCRAIPARCRGRYWLAAAGQARPKPRGGRDLAAFIPASGGRPGKDVTPIGGLRVFCGYNGYRMLPKTSLTIQRHIMEYQAQLARHGTGLTEPGSDFGYRLSVVSFGFRLSSQLIGARTSGNCRAA